jgi:hypothetical protein
VNIFGLMKGEGLAQLQVGRMVGRYGMVGWYALMGINNDRYGMSCAYAGSRLDFLRVH